MSSANDPRNLADDPDNPKVAVSCFDLLLLELVPMAYRIAADLAAKEEAWLATKRRSLKTNRHSLQSHSGASNAGTTGGTVKSTAAGAKSGVEGEDPAFAGLGIGGIGGTAPGMDEEELRETVFYRLEAIGYRVGLGVTERYFCSSLEALRKSLTPLPGSHAIDLASRTLWIS